MSERIEDSLTLDLLARMRATEALSSGYKNHLCFEWNEDGICAICWDIAAAVVRAAEGLQVCPEYGENGSVATGDYCPDCGGDGLRALGSF